MRTKKNPTLGEQVQAAVGLAFARLGGEPFVSVASRSGLSLATIYRLWWGLASEHTHAGTIIRLGEVAGLKFTLADNAIYAELMG